MLCEGEKEPCSVELNLAGSLTANLSADATSSVHSAHVICFAFARDMLLSCKVHVFTHAS